MIIWRIKLNYCISFWWRPLVEGSLSLPCGRRCSWLSQPRHSFQAYQILSQSALVNRKPVLAGNRTQNPVNRRVCIIPHVVVIKNPWLVWDFWIPWSRYYSNQIKPEVWMDFKSYWRIQILPIIHSHHHSRRSSRDGKYDDSTSSCGAFAEGAMMGRQKKSSPSLWDPLRELQESSYQNIIQ